MESRAQSAASTTGSIMLDSQRGNPMAMVRHLYTLMEPQLCESYRQNVVNTAPVTTVTDNSEEIMLNDESSFMRKRKLKAARIVIEAVAEIQDRHRRAINRREGRRLSTRPKLDPIKGSPTHLEPVSSPNHLDPMKISRRNSPSFLEPSSAANRRSSNIDSMKGIQRNSLSNVEPTKGARQSTQSPKPQ